MNEFAGRVMALDLGGRRIGIALSDPTRTIATPLQAIERGSRQADFATLATIAADNAVTLLLVGLPTLLDGSETDMTRWVRDYAAACAAALALPLVLWDETLSTQEAHKALREQGLNRRRRHARIDATAAAIFLQAYLDAREGGLTVAPPPAMDEDDR